MPLRACIRAHTHREYLTWQKWLDNQWNSPTRSDNYAMQVAMEVRRVLSKSPNRIKLKHFLLHWDIGEQTPKMSKEQVAQQAKRRWFGWLRPEVKKRGG